MAALAQQPTRTRFVIMALLFVSVVINYLDRANLSIAAPLLAKELAIDSVRMGLVFSAFGWSYVFCQVPGGWLVDRVHPRTLYAVLIALWSVATVLLGFSASLAMLFALRLAIGALEAPSFPINNRVVTTWFPERERATAIGFYTSGQFVGLAFLTPVLMYLQVHFGWRSVFISVGLLGMVWAAVWYMVYRGPLTYRGANPAEIELIRQGGGLVDLSEQSAAGAKRAFNAGDLGQVLSKSKLWGLYIGQYAATSTLWFFLTWFPTYLVQYRGMSFQQAGFLASLPFLAAFVRGPLFRSALGFSGAARLFAECRAQDADRDGIAALDQHHRRQLRPDAGLDHHFHGFGILRKRAGIHHLVAGIRGCAEATDRADRRSIQLHREHVFHHRAGHHWRSGAGRRLLAGSHLYLGDGSDRGVSPTSWWWAKSNGFRTVRTAGSSLFMAS